jgi:hypothetical protein
MPTECSAERFDFGRVDGRTVEAAFDAGLVTSDAGALLLVAADRAIDLVGRFANCFGDHRRQDLIEHTVATLIGQRVFGIALGYEDLNDHDELRHDPLMAVLSGKLAARRVDCAPVAGKSTLNRLELSQSEPSRYRKIAYDAAAIEALPVMLFLEAQATAEADHPRSRRHRRPAARASGGALLPRLLRLLLLSAAVRVLRPASVGGQAAPLRHRRQRGQHRGGRTGCSANPCPLAVRAHRAAGGLGLCARGAHGVVRTEPRGLPVRARPQRPSGRHDRRAACRARAAAEKTGRPARRFKDFKWTTLDSWSRRRRVVAKAEWTHGEANPRFVVTSLKRVEAGARQLYEDIYCARGDMENRIKECQLDLYADRTSAATMRANQLRLWFASMAYVLICADAAHRPC